MPSRRAAPTYDWDADGQPSKQGSGIFILKPEVEAIVKKPSWFGTETVFRPYPVVSYDNPQEFEPYRIARPDGRTRFTDWIRRYPCAWGVGTPSTTFLIKKLHPLYDPWTSPLGQLYRAIENACKKGDARDPRWYPLRESGMNRGKALKPAGQLFLIQGALLRHDKTEYSGGKNPPPLGWGKNSSFILMLSQDAGNGLVDELNKEREGYQGSPTDYESRFANGDPVSPLTGRFFHFWERGSNPQNRNYQTQPTQTSNASAFDDMGSGHDDVNTGGAGKFDKKGFDIEITTHYNGKAAKFNQNGEQNVRDHWKDWDDILYFPTEIEQAHLLAKCYPHTAIIYAFESINKDWIPDECWHALKNPKSANFRDRTDFEQSPPAFDDGFEAAEPTKAAAPAAAARATKPAPQAGDEADPYSSAAAPVSAKEDATLPTAAPTAVAEAPPVPPSPPAPAGGDANSRTAATIARLTAARNKIGS